MANYHTQRTMAERRHHTDDMVLTIQTGEWHAFRRLRTGNGDELPLLEAYGIRLGGKSDSSSRPMLPNFVDAMHRGNNGSA